MCIFLRVHASWKRTGVYRKALKSGGPQRLNRPGWICMAEVLKSGGHAGSYAYAREAQSQQGVL